MAKPRQPVERRQIQGDEPLAEAIRRAARQVDEAHWHLRTAAYQAAQDLARHFRVEKAIRHADQRAKNPRTAYTPLTLKAQGIGESLELVWRLEHRRRRGAAMPPRPKWTTTGVRRVTGGYDLRQLTALAQPWERDLVVETEMAARVIRAVWAEVTKLNLTARSLPTYVAEAPRPSGHAGQLPENIPLHPERQHELTESVPLHQES